MYPRRQTSIQNTLRSASLLVLLAFGANASGQVDGTAPLASDSGVTTLEQDGFSGGVSLNGTYFDVRHQTGKGVGYSSDGFTQFGLFTPFWGSSDNWFIAPNARVNLTNDSRSGFNAGLVSRLYSEQFDRIVGVNAYWDNDKSQLNNRYDQVGFGFETLGPILDFRANAYVPTTNESNFVRATGLSTDIAFFGNRLGLIGTQVVESALKGYDVEFGVPLTPSTPWLRGYAGMYAYQQSSGTDPVGFRGRVEGWISNDTSLGFMVTHDKHFGTNVNATVDWRFAGFVPTRYFPNFSTRDRMLMPVQRSWRITASQYEEEVKVLADNPRTGNNYFVVWIDPDRNAAGNGVGTFENPYTDLPADVPNQTDLVLVRRGDTTQANPLNGQIALPNNTRLLGEGFAHVFDATATFGGVTRVADNSLLRDAGFSNTGLYPFLSNNTGDTVRVANGNEVAAFVMNGAAGAAITGPNVRGFNFHHLEISNNAGGGIVLPGAGGTGLVTTDGQTILGGRIADINRNLVGGWANPDGLGDNGGPGGIVVGTGIAPLDLAIERVSMNATPGGQQYGVRLRTAQGALNTRIDDLSTSGGNVEAGLSIEQTTGPIAATINLLQASDNDGNGLRLLTGAQRTMRVDGTNITANRNGGDNLQIADNPALAALPHNVTFDGLFSNSSFDDSVNGNGVSLNMTNGIKSLSLTDVSASGNALSGVDLVSTGGRLNFNANRLTANDNTGHNLNALLSNTRFTGVATDSVFDRSLATGIMLDATGGQSSLLLNRVSVSENQFGLVVNGHGNAQIGNAANAVFDGVSVIDSTLTGNTFDAINTLADGGSHLELFVDPTDLSGSGRHAFRFDVQSTSDLVAFLDQTNFDNSGQNPGALDLSAVGGQGRAVFGLVDGAGSLANVTIQNSTLRNAADDGVFVGATNGSIANVTLTDVTIVDSGRTQAGASGIEVNAASGSTINLDLTGVTNVDNTAIGGSGAFGLTVVSRDLGSVVNATATGTTFDNAGVNAVDVLVDAGVATVTLTGTTFNNAGVNAMNLLVDNAGGATVTLTDTFGNGAGASGLNALVSNTGFLTLDLLRTGFDGAGQLGAGDGLNAVVNTGGILNACLEDSSFSDGVSGAGLRLLATGAGSLASVDVENSFANRNLQGGLVANADAGAALHLRTINSEFNNNGTVGALDFDGVFVRANGFGTEALMLFNTTSADDNSRNGFNFEAAGGAVMTARIDEISASNNGAFGVRLDATGAGTAAILLPSGTNTVMGNGLGSYSLNYAGVDLAVVALTGSFNGVAGDGVHVDINNVGTAVVSVTGNGTTDTIDNNMGDGVDIRISNANSVGIRIADYNSISGNAEDGVHIELTNIATAAAVEVLGVPGQTDMTNNGDEGVDITLTNVALGTFVPPAGLDPLRIIPLVNADPTICYPVPIDVPFGTFVTIPAADGILIDNLNISRPVAAPAGHNGIAVTGTNVTGAGNVALTNNTINNFDNGIAATFGGGSSFGGLVIDNSVITNSAISGINVGLNASNVPLSITNTNVTGSGGTGLNVLLTNVIGGAGITITDTNVTTSAGHGVSVAGNGVLGDIALTNVRAGFSTLGDGARVVLTGGSADSVVLTNVDTDNNFLNGTNIDLSNMLVNNRVVVDGQGLATANGNGNGLVGDGVHVALLNVTGVPDLQVGGFASIDNSRQDGIDVSALGTDLGAVDLSNNTVTDSFNGNGLSLVLDSNVTGPITMGFNNVNNSALDGIRLNLDGVLGGADVTKTNNIISNSGMIGLHFTAVGATLGNIVDPSIVTNSQLDGVHVDLTNATFDSFLFDQFTISNSGLSGAGDGLEILMNGATSTGPVTVSNTAITNSRNDGARLDLTNATIASLLVDQFTSTDSGLGGTGDGLEIILDGTNGTAPITVSRTNVTNSRDRGVFVHGSGVLDLGDVTLTNVTSTTTTNQEGVAVFLDTGTVGSINLNTVSATDSGATGIRVSLGPLTVGPTVSINGGNTAVSNDNGGDGISLVLSNVVGAAGNPDVNISGYNSVNNNGNRGIALLSNLTNVGDVTVLDNTVSRSLGAQGVVIDLSNNVVGSLIIADENISDSFGRGLDVILDNVTGSPVINLSNTSVLRSGGRGVSIEGSTATLGSVTLTNVSSDTTTADEGVAVIFDTASTTGSIALRNVSATNSAAGGILVDLNTVTLTGANPGVRLDGLNTAQSTLNGGDGILVRLNAVTGAVLAPDVNVSNYLLVDQNVGRGIGIESNGSAVDAVTVLNNMVSNSTAGQGIQVDLTGSALRSLIVDFNTISDSSDRGLDVILDTVTGSSTIAVRNTTALNSGGRGISVEGSTATLGSVTLLNVSSDTTTADEGVAVVFDTNSSVGPIVLNNVSATNSFAGGILVDLNTVAMTGPNAGISVNGLTRAQSTNNGGDGILVNLNAVIGAPDVSVINYLLVDTNFGRGIAVDSNGSTLDDVTVSNNIVSNSTNGQGIQVQLAGSTLDTLVVSNNTVSDTRALLIGQGIQIDLTGSTLASLVANNDNVTNSADRGIDIVLTGTLGLPTITVSNSTATNSGGRGVSLDGVGATLGDVTLTNVTSTLTTADEGVVLSLNAGTVGSVLLDTVSADQSFAGGILVSLVGGENVGPSITLNGQGNAFSTNNGGDGILVDLNVIGTPDVTIENYAFVDTNAGRGIALQTNASTVGAINVSNNIVSNSTAGQGMHLDLTASQVGSVLVDSNTISDSFGRGLDVVLDNSFGFPGIAISNTTVTNSGDRGVSVGGTNAFLGDVTLTNVSSTTTLAAEGVAVDLDNGTVGSIVLNNVSAAASFTTGILVDLNTQTVGPEITLNGQGAGQVTGNNGDGIWITLNTVNGTPTLAVTDYGVNGLIGTNQGDGVIIDQVNAADVGTVNIANNIINANNTNGVLFLSNNSDTGQVTLTENQITGQVTGDGVHVTALGDNDGLLDFDFFRNTISGNTLGRGVNFDLQYPAALVPSITLNANFENNTVALNGQEGISIVIDNDVTANVNVLSNSAALAVNPISGLFNNDISNNGSAGLLISTDDTARFNLLVGSVDAIPVNANTFADNADAGIGLLMNNSGGQTGLSSTFNISNVSVTGTAAGTNANFTGQGIGVVLNDTSELRFATVGDAALFNTIVSDNETDGFGLTMVQSSIVQNLTIRNSSFIETAGTGSAQNNGININRRNDSKLTGTIITANTFTGNSTTGVLLDLQGGNNNIEAPFGTYTMDVRIGGPAAANGNTFTGNGRGIDLFLSADAQVDADIQFNTFTTNTSDGIRGRTDFDADIVTSVWEDNTFINNAGDAINLVADRRSSINVAIDDTVVNNTPGTGLDGIQIANSITTPGTSQITVNVTDTSITGVGRDGIQVDTTNTAPFLGVTLNLTDVNITNVGQDGIDLFNGGGGFLNLTSLRTTVVGPGSAVGTGNGLVATGTNVGPININSTNDIFRNFGGDGVSLNASGSNDLAFLLGPNLTANFVDMQSRFNGGRGVELNNTNDATMDVSITGTVNPTPTGGAVANSRIEENSLNGLFVENRANGSGTNNSIELTVDQVSIRGNGVTAAVVPDDDRNGVWVRAGTSSGGHINATITRNEMSGNQNIDFVTQSFTATDPVAVVSQYTDNANHIADPLARLGLIFTNNNGDQIDTTRFGATYNNADGFKSPLAVFNATNRLRNAQRFVSPANLNRADTVQAAPAPAAGVFAGALGGIGPNTSLVGLGAVIPVGTNHDITVFNNGNNALTIVPALGAAPAVGDNFNVLANSISGTGTSTFRVSNVSTVLNGNPAVGTENLFTNIITNFGSTVNLIDGAGGNQDDNPNAGIFGGTVLNFRWNSVAAPLY